MNYCLSAVGSSPVVLSFTKGGQGQEIFFGGGREILKLFQNAAGKLQGKCRANSKGSSSHMLCDLQREEPSGILEWAPFLLHVRQN